MQVDDWLTLDCVHQYSKELICASKYTIDLTLDCSTIDTFKRYLYACQSIDNLQQLFFDSHIGK